jgi:hypothetical protein
LRHVEDGRARLPQEGRQLKAHLEAQLGVDIAQGIVEQQQFRRTRQRARQRRALLLAVRQLARRVGEHLVDLQQPGDALDAFANGRGRHAPRRQRTRDVVERGHVREEREVLEGHADAAVIGGDIRHILAVDEDGATIRIVDAGDQPQQDRLARAGRTEDDDDLSLVGGERDAVEHGPVLERFGEVLQLEARHPLPLHRAEREALDQIALGVEG